MVTPEVARLLAENRVLREQVSRSRSSERKWRVEYHKLVDVLGRAIVSQENVGIVTADKHVFIKIGESVDV